MRPHVWLGGGVLSAFALAVSLFAPDAKPASNAAGDRVGFPADYRTTFQALRSSYKSAKDLVGTTYANPLAASITTIAGQPYPFGSFFVFEWTVPVKDGAGVPLLEADGQTQKGEVTRIDVMRREPGYGEAYGESRAGEWEFASYRPDGTSVAEEPELQQCARCHAKAAARDFVFRGRFPPISPP